jgi:hypothetical protein
MIKKVRFNKIIKVLYIPTNKEYFNNFLNDLLWWDENDYRNFKLSSIIQIHNLMDIHKNMNHTDAIKILYQPLSYDENNFKLE